MKIVFLLNTPGFLRYFDVTIERLLARGNEVVLAFTRPDLRPESLEIFERWSRVPRVLGKAPDRNDELAGIATSIRAAADFVRYLDPRFERMEYLRNRRRRRAFELAPWTRVIGLRPSLPRPLPRLLLRGLALAERALPSASDIERYLREIQPDALLVSPLVTGASPQTDYVKAARRLGIPCALCVASWDNLTNKGLIRERPHRVIVWNEAQRREAVELHGVDASLVDVTGAQPFDRWFGREPSCPREAFCLKAGLDPTRPYLMFVGSTSNIAREGVEEEFVRRWIASIRGSEDRLVSTAGILVRPHPDRPGSWEQMKLGGLEDVVLWPPRRPNSVTVDARTDYFDSLYHASVVVGINTSAMIEAAIIGRPVLTVCAPEFEQAQEGTMHFGYLLPGNGGFVSVAGDLADHLQSLGRHLREPEAVRPARDAFIESFIRPNGRDRPSNEVLVEAIERLAGGPRPEPDALPLRHLPLRGLLLVAGRMAERRRIGLDPDLTRDRLGARTLRLAATTERLRPLSPRLALAVSAVAEAHERRAAARVALLVRRRDDERKRRKARSREEKRRGLELLGDRRLEVDLRP